MVVKILDIHLKANPHPLRLNTIGYQKTYHYPTNPFSPVLFRNLIPFNWFSDNSPINQKDKIDLFIKGKLDRKTLSLKQSSNWLDIITVILIPIIFLVSVPSLFLTIPWATIYEFDRNTQTLTIILQKLFGHNIAKEYSLDRIKQVKLDRNYTTNFNRGRIILEFDPSYDYPIDEFADAEKGEKNFGIIKKFIDQITVMDRQL